MTSAFTTLVPIEDGQVVLHAAVDNVVDTRRLAGTLKFLREATRFEAADAAAAIAAWLLLPPCLDTPHAMLDRVEVQLGAMRLARTSAEATVTVETKPFGWVDVVYETATCGLYRERVASRGTVPTHVHHGLDEAELVLGNGLLLQGRPVAAGLAHEWPRGFAHRYDNPTKRDIAFMCIDRPKFVPSDEVEVEVPNSELKMVPSTRYF